MDTDENKEKKGNTKENKKPIIKKEYIERPESWPEPPVDEEDKPPENSERQNETEQK